MPLAPSTEFVVQLRATNQRPEMPNHSEYVSAKAKTKGDNNIWIHVFSQHFHEICFENCERIMESLEKFLKSHLGQFLFTF